MPKQGETVFEIMTPDGEVRYTVVYQEDGLYDLVRGYQFPQGSGEWARPQYVVVEQELDVVVSELKSFFPDFEFNVQYDQESGEEYGIIAAPKKQLRFLTRRRPNVHSYWRMR